MRRENRKKRRIIIALIGVLCLMTAGYAAFRTQLTVGTTTNINTNWDVEIIDVTSGTTTGNAENVYTPTWTSLTANMEANVYEKGDSVEYDVTIKNKGDLDAKIDDIVSNIKSDNDAVRITYSGYAKGQVLPKNQQMVVKVKIEYNPEYEGELTEDVSSEVAITFNYTQATGGDVNPSPVQYLMTYDYQTNGGKSSTATNQYITTGTEVTLNATAAKAGYEFVGWNTNKDATSGLNKVTVDDNLTVYAIFRKTITITYTKGENVSEVGRVNDVCTVYNKTTSCSKTLPTITPSNAAYTADGWYVDGKKIGAAGANYSFSKNVTAQARVTLKELEFEDQTKSEEYSTSGSQINITPATNGSGSYTYSEVSETSGGTNTNYLSISNGKIVVSPNTPAGTYTYVIRVTDNVTNKTKEATYTITISKKDPTLTVDNTKVELTYKTAGNKTYTYDGDGTVSCESSDTNKVTCSVDTANHKIVVTPVAVTTSDVTITVNATAGNNYNAASNKTFKVSVEAYQPVINITSKSAPYTGSAISANTATVTLTNNETYSGTITYTYYNGTGCEGTALSGAPTNAGNYSVKASITAQGNYKAASKCVSHTITKSDTTTTLSAQTKTYNGSNQAASGASAKLSSNNTTISGATFTYQYYSGTGCSGTALSNAPKDAGTYSVKASVNGTSNYNSSTSSCVTYTINKKEIALGTHSATYNGT
ncbi:MAG: InlB B-repeat-containing protein, partial [Alphaproteobacteria bacterium]|nr:InlB B-repeat-containing protein [Alphaproteobacteria bacterium]